MGDLKYGKKFLVKGTYKYEVLVPAATKEAAIDYVKRGNRGLRYEEKIHEFETEEM
jgi:hypothetical protein